MSARIGIFFATDTGRTRRIAKDIARKLGGLADAPVNINKTTPEEFLAYPALILGTPTLGEGALPGLDTGSATAGWTEFMPTLEKLDLSGKTVALFGLGDQDKYGEFFVGALRPLYDALAARGARLVGHWSIDDYDFIDSEAIENGEFLGLALDQHNQPALTEWRVDTWLAQVLPALKGEA